MPKSSSSMHGRFTDIFHSRKRGTHVLRRRNLLCISRDTTGHLPQGLGNTQRSDYGPCGGIKLSRFEKEIARLDISEALQPISVNHEATFLHDSSIGQAFLCPKSRTAFTKSQSSPWRRLISGESFLFNSLGFFHIIVRIQWILWSCGRLSATVSWLWS
jgi:hypothetical protein